MGELEPEGLQGLHGFEEPAFVLEEGAFGEFQFEEVRRQLVAAHQVEQLFTQARIVDMHTRHVHGDGRGREAVVNPAAQGDAGLLPDVFIQPDDEAVLLEQGDETGPAASAPRWGVPSAPALPSR